MTRWYKNLHARPAIEAECGQGLAEYILLLSLIAVVGTSAATAFGQAASVLFSGSLKI